MRYVVKYYLIPYSTQNETMFDDLRRYGFTFTVEPLDSDFFELYVMEKPVNLEALETILKWYV